MKTNLTEQSPGAGPKPTLNAAIQEGKLEAVQSILEKSTFEINQIDEKEGVFPLILALRGGNPEIIQTILNHKDFRFHTLDSQGVSQLDHALDYARTHDDSALLKLLIERVGHQDDLSYPDYWGDGPAWLTKRAKAIGFNRYVFQEEGVCFGLSHMGMQACLSHDYASFKRRLRLMYLIPVASFKNKIESLEQSRGAFFRQARSEFSALDDASKEKLEADLQEKLTLIKEEVEVWRKEEDRSESKTIEEYARRKSNLLFEVFIENKMQEKFTKDELLLMDTRAFFDGIALYQRPDMEPLVFSQFGLLQNVTQTAPYTQSLTMEKQGGVVPLTKFCGHYNEDRLQNYFHGLKEAIDKADPPLETAVTLSLHAGNHRIMVAYEPKLKQWIMLDPELIGRPFYPASVCSAFRTSRPLIETTVFGLETEYALVKPVMDDWRNGQKWKQAHAIQQPHELQWGRGEVDLAFQMVVSNQADSLKEYLPLLNVNKYYDKGTLLMRAIVEGSMDAFQVLLEAKGIDVNQEFQGQRALHIAIDYKAYDAIAALLHRNDINLNGMGRLLFGVCKESCNINVVKAFLEHPEVLQRFDPEVLLMGAINTTNLAMISEFFNCETIKITDDKIDFYLKTARETNNEAVIKLVSEHPRIRKNEPAMENTAQFRSTLTTMRDSEQKSATNNEEPNEKKGFS